MTKTENIIDLRRLWRAVRQLRWLYLASILGFLGLAIAYWMVALPKYTATGMVLIEDQNGGSMAGGAEQMMKTFSVGGFGAAAVDNEMLVMASHDVAMKVVKNLQLNRSYTARLDGEKEVLWGTSPIAVEAPSGYFDTLSVGLKVKVDILDNGNADIKVTKGLLQRTVGEAENVALPAVVKTKYGDLHVLKTASFDGSPYKTVKVGVTNYEFACKALMKAWLVDVATKLGDAILVNYDAPNRNMGIDVVNAIMSEYNAKRLGRTHAQAAEEVAYYDERIAELLGELNESEQKEAKFLANDGLFATPETASLLIGASMTSRISNIEAGQTVAYYENVLETLSKDMNGDNFIPVVENIDDANVRAYNEAVFQKRKLERSATENNKALKQLKERIDMLRSVVHESSSQMLAKAKNDMKGRANVSDNATSRLVNIPQKSMEYASLIRDKQLKNTMYAFLRQSREQSMLQLYTTTTSGYVFEEAYCDLKPSNLKKYIMVLILLMLGVIFPSCLAVWMMLRHKNVSALMDLAKTGIENQSVALDGSKAQLNKLRSLITDTPQRKLVYVAGYECNVSGVMASLAESLAAIDKKTEIQTLSPDNDTLLGSAWSNDMDAVLKANDYVLVPVPNPDRLNELAHNVDEQECQLLVAVGADKVKLKYLMTMLHGMAADKVRICLVK